MRRVSDRSAKRDERSISSHLAGDSDRVRPVHRLCQTLLEECQREEASPLIKADALAFPHSRIYVGDRPNKVCVLIIDMIIMRVKAHSVLIPQLPQVLTGHQEMEGKCMDCPNLIAFLMNKQSQLHNMV